MVFAKNLISSFFVCWKRNFENVEFASVFHTSKWTLFKILVVCMDKRSLKVELFITSTLVWSSKLLLLVLIFPEGKNQVPVISFEKYLHLMLSITQQQIMECFKVCPLSVSYLKGKQKWKMFWHTKYEIL